MKPRAAPQGRPAAGRRSETLSQTNTAQKTPAQASSSHHSRARAKSIGGERRTLPEEKTVGVKGECASPDRGFYL